MACQIIKNDNGTVKEVLASNGEPSVLWDTLESLPFLTEEQRIDIYTNSQNVKKGVLDANGEPILVVEMNDTPSEVIADGITLSTDFFDTIERNTDKEFSVGYISGKVENLDYVDGTITQQIVKYSNQITGQNKNFEIDLEGERVFAINKPSDFKQLFTINPKGDPTTMSGFVVNNIKKGKIKLNNQKQNIKSKLDKNYKNGQIPKHLSQRENRTLKEGNKFLQRVFTYFGGVDTYLQNYKQAQNAVQGLKEVAKDLGEWVKDTNPIFGKANVVGAESEVWFNVDRNIVTKAMGTAVQDGTERTLNKILIHNVLFPETSYTLTGLSQNGDQLNFLLEQPLILIDENNLVYQDEVDTYMKNLGFDIVDTDENGLNIYANEEYVVKDLHSGNIVRTKQGEIVVIDALIEYNTPDLYDGIRVPIGEEYLEEQTVTITEIDVNPNERTIVAVVGDKKIGSINLVPQGENYTIDTSNLREEYQGNYIGTSMYLEAIETMDRPVISDMYRTEAAEKVWNRLVTDGYAERMADGRFISKSNVDFLFTNVNANYSQTQVNQLTQANLLFEQGVPMNQIKKITNWHFDNKEGWLYETPNDYNKVITNVNNKKVSTLKDLLGQEDEIFSLIPDLNINIKIEKNKKGNSNYNLGTNTITLFTEGEKINLEEAQTIYHETQHAIAYKIGMDGGGNTQVYQKIAEVVLRETYGLPITGEVMSDVGKELYSRNKGENLAFITEERADISKEVPKQSDILQFYSDNKDLNSILKKVGLIDKNGNSLSLMESMKTFNIPMDKLVSNKQFTQDQQTTIAVTKYLQSRGMPINILSQRDMNEEVKRRGYDTLSDTENQLKDKNEKVYGFYDNVSGQIYLTEELLNSNTLTHELWHWYRPILKKQALQGNKTAEAVLNKMTELADVFTGGIEGTRKIYENSQRIELADGSNVTFGETSDIRFQIIGEQGASRVEKYRDSLLEAKRLSNQGVSDIEIENQTGWYFFQGQWRMLSEDIVKDFKIQNNTKEKELTLKQVIGNDNILFKTYPEISDTKVIFLDNNSEGFQTPSTFQKSSGMYVAESNTILINTTNRDSSKQQYTLAHEVTHKIQDIEGFPKGGNAYSVLQEAMRLLNIRDTNFQTIYFKLENTDKSNLSENQHKIIDASLDTIKAIVNKDAKFLASQYRHLMGEIDATIVETTQELFDRGEPVMPYSMMLDFYQNQKGINLDNIFLLGDGNVEFQTSADMSESSVYAPRPNETLEQYHNRRTDEAIARILGENSTEYFEKLAKENGLNKEQTKSFVEKVKQFIKDFANWLKEQLGLTDITPEQVAQMTNKELFDAIITSMFEGDYVVNSKQQIEQAIQRNNGNPLNLAPNGKPSILYQSYKDLGYSDKEAEILTAQVFSDNFKSWFGYWQNDPENASKVVDSDGMPLIVFHGTTAYNKINEFIDNEDGFYFADSINTANDYGHQIIPVFLNIKNPTVQDYNGEKWENVFEEVQEQRDLSRGSKTEYDGSIMQNIEDPRIQDSDTVYSANNYVVEESNQIKSATENTGQFSNESNDIRFQIIGEQGAQKIKKYKDLLDKAKELEKNNVSLSDITDQTGWFKYKGDWRFFSNEALEQFKINENEIKQGTEQKLSDILSTDNILFTMYPSLGEVKIIVSQDTNSPKNASYNERGKIIKTNLFKGRELESAIAHEVAHFIQQREGLPQGGNYNLLLQQLVSQLNFIPKNTELTLNQVKELLNENKTESNKSIVEATLSILDNSTDEAKYKVYRAIMGEMDAHIVTKAYNNRETPYTYLELLDEELIEQKLSDTDVIVINSQGKVSFTPKIMRSSDVSFQIIGEQGAANLDAQGEATTRLDNLQVAKDMEVAGKTPKEIRMATGWERGADGKWRYEIDDIINVKSKKGADVLSELYRRQEKKGKNLTVSDLVSEELNNAYPELKEIKILLSGSTDGTVAYYKNIPLRGRIINLAGLYKYDENKHGSPDSVILHEIQHAIQDIEGFAIGGSKTLFDLFSRIKDKKKVYEIISKSKDKKAATFNISNSDLSYSDKSTLNEIAYALNNFNEVKKRTVILQDWDNDTTSYEKYKQLAGEVEARNVQERMNMTPEQRRQTLLEETEDVAREDQIFLQENLGVSERRVEHTPQEVIQDLSGNTYPANEFDIITYETEYGQIRYITNENGDMVMLSDKNTGTPSNESNDIRFQIGKQEVSTLKKGTTVTENPIQLIKGTFGKRNIDGSIRTAHPNVQGTFTSVDEKVAERYADYKGANMARYEIPSGTTIEVVNEQPKGKPLSQLRKDETDAINESQAQIVKLITFDSRGQEEQYIIKDYSLIPTLNEALINLESPETLIEKMIQSGEITQNCRV